MSGLRRTTRKSGRRPMAENRQEAIRRSLQDGQGIRPTARLHKASTTTVTAIKRSLGTVEGTVLDRGSMTDEPDKPVVPSTQSTGRSGRAIFSRV